MINRRQILSVFLVFTLVGIIWFLRTGEISAPVAFEHKDDVELFDGGVAEIRSAQAETLPLWLDSVLEAENESGRSADPRRDAGLTETPLRLYGESDSDIASAPYDTESVPAPLPVRRERALVNDEQRNELAGALRSYTESLYREAREEAERFGFPLRSRDDEGRTLELVAVVDGKPVYRTTFNATVAASTGAALLRNDEDAVRGEGVAVGIWDEARILAFHREFDEGRVVNHNEAPFYSHHSTHVAGTIGARGTRGPAMGMAPEARIEGYDWNQSLAEMVHHAALYPDEPGGIQIANHSYGLVSGWFFLGEPGAFVFTGFDRFGRYDQFAYLTDVVSHAAPYLLSVWAAGNHRSGDPAPGDPIVWNDRVVPYDPDVHPPGDAEYKRGFDTINSFQIAKNALTIGAIEFEAPEDRGEGSGSARMTEFSSWGPTDDGRIKPDVVAHGVRVLSPIALDGWYARASGTSMAAPAVSGSVALLVDLFDDRFPGHALRASTLKALLVHTADDLGNPGPDYRYGWGLINTPAAAELINAYYEGPRSNVLVEGLLSETRPGRSYSVEWDGESPVLATLAWTDPPPSGPVEVPDDRTPVLVNNLHLEISAPNGETVHYPFRLDPANPAAPSTTGVNDVDNVLRVEVPAPGEGTYTVSVDYDGVLYGGEQVYSLIVTGAQAVEPPGVGISVSSITPAFAPNDDVVIVEVEGEHFLMGTDLRLTRSEEEPIEGFGIEVTDSRITARFDLYGATPGQWDFELLPPDGDELVLPDAFEVEPACHFAFDPEIAEVPVAGGFLTASLNSFLGDCEWTLNSSESWLLFVTPRTGSGDTEVIYSVGGHHGSAIPRSAAISVGSRELLLVEQDGVAPIRLNDGQVRSDFITGRERQFDWKYYRIDVPHMQAGKVEFSVAGLTGDADLYVRYGEKPDLVDFDCRPFLGGTQNELCELTDPAPGVWWIGVNNWETGRIDYMISATVFIERIRYDDWVRNSFDPDEAEDPGISGPESDPGAFGVPNILRYALAMDPRTPDKTDFPRAGVMAEAGNMYSFIEYTYLKAATDLTISVEGSDDLVEWGQVDGVAEIIDENAATRTVRVREPDPVAAGVRRFLRLRVTLD